MKTALKAAVLGIGTELTSGQIVNANASWISGRLKKMGLLTSAHLVVPDDKELILEGLEFCASKSDLIFVTGGLGPTTDDFTREIIAQWSGAELAFDSPTWDYIAERLSVRGVAVEEFQKQQCYFPRGSRILKNSRGTAHAFHLQVAGKAVFVLPGPPREIEIIWQDHIESWLRELAKDDDSHITLSWDILGRSEGEVAKLTEEILGGSGLEIGYRVHMPYVEVKVSFLQSERAEKENFFKALDSAFSRWIVLRENQDAAEMFSDCLAANDGICFVDEVSGGYLWQRLQLPFRQREYWKSKSVSYSNRKGNFLSGEEVIFKILKAADFGAQISWEQGSDSGTEIISNPYLHSSMEERRQQYFSERALLFWAQRGKSR